MELVQREMNIGKMEIAIFAIDLGVEPEHQEALHCTIYNDIDNMVFTVIFATPFIITVMRDIALIVLIVVHIIIKGRCCVREGRETRGLDGPTQKVALPTT